MYVAHRMMRLMTHSHVVHVAVAEARIDTLGRVYVGKYAFSTSPIQSPFQIVPIHECTEPGYDYIFAPTAMLGDGIELLRGILGKPYTHINCVYDVLCRPTHSKKWVCAHTQHIDASGCATMSCSQAAALVCLKCGILDSCVKPECCAPHELYCLLKAKYGLIADGVLHCCVA